MLDLMRPVALLSVCGSNVARCVGYIDMFIIEQELNIKMEQQQQSSTCLVYIFVYVSR